MKIINNQKGYTTSIILLLLLIPLLLLLTITIDEYNHEVDNTVENLQTKKMKSTTKDFENEIATITKQTLHDTTLDVITRKQALTNSKKYIKDKIQSKIDTIEQKQRKNNINIECTVNEIKPADDPFKIEIHYTLHVTTNNSNSKIQKEENRHIEITDTKYPVYDSLPTLKTRATFTDSKVEYTDKLANYITINNSNAYLNSTQHVTIKKCPINDYSQHGNSNITIKNCLNNHYYHNSHDGLCLLCRLENRTTCEHYGFETFILPTEKFDKAPASIDHVLLNDQQGQYEGNNITIDNNTIIYLDNGHKIKYGL